MTETLVKIGNYMPQVIVCSGHNYEESKYQNTQELSLFIERDIYRLIKNLKEFDIKFYLKGSYQEDPPNITIWIAPQNDRLNSFLKLKIEEILWSYNSLVLAQKNGLIHPGKPRFSYIIKFVDPNSNVKKLTNWFRGRGGVNGKEKR